MWCIASVAARNGRRCCGADAGEIARRGTLCRSIVCGAWLTWRCGHDRGLRMVDGGKANSGDEAVAGGNRDGHVALSGPNGGAVETVCASVGRGGEASVAAGAGMFSSEGQFVSNVEL